VVKKDVRPCRLVSAHHRISTSAVLPASGAKRRVAHLDGFLALALFKLQISLWDYLGAGLAVPGCQAIPPLSDLILARTRFP
jgi:hypothetical protein